MKNRLKLTRTVTLTAATVLAVGLGFGLPAVADPAAPGAARSGPVASPEITTNKAAVAQFWTPERLRNAKPADLPAADPAKVREPGPAVAAGPTGRVQPQKAPPAARGESGGGSGPGFGATAAPWYGSTTSPPATTSGRVFFTNSSGVGYSCSGSTVNSDGKNLVFTAGHCVNPGNGGQWHSNWVFIPRYNNGNAPYGVWSARQLWSWTSWTQSGNRAYDFGAAVLNTNGSGQRVVNVVGGQGIEWNYPLVQFIYQFGYPVNTPFNGGSLQYCTGNTFNDGGFVGINCNMTEGASGGPWLDEFGGTYGYLDSVNSWVFWNANGVRYKWNGPYFGNEVRDLYNTIKNL